MPPCLLAGDYLMRIQHVGIHVPGHDAEFHVACAQLKVTGQGKTVPALESTVRIPEFLHKDDPAFNVNIFHNFRSFKIPGPKVWTC